MRFGFGTARAKFGRRGAINVAVRLAARNEQTDAIAWRS